MSLARTKTAALVISVVASLYALPLVARSMRVPPFTWSETAANLAHALLAYDGAHTIHIIHQAKAGRTEVRFEKNGQLAYAFAGGPQTVFRVSGDVVFYADYSRISTGCRVVAYDLAKRKELWRTPLKGLGPIGHSKYFNYVNLEIAPAPYESSPGPPVVVAVYAHEAAGDYAEFLDQRTGKTLYHHVYITK